MTEARGYSWPQAEPGNELAMRHGAWSPRRVDPLAAEMVKVTLDLPWLRAADRPAVWAWARTEARIQLLTEYLDNADVEQDGKVRPAADLLTRLEARAESLRSRLGLDPLSRARLGRDTAAGAVDLARLWASEGAEDGVTGDGASSGRATAESATEGAEDG